MKFWSLPKTPWAVIKFAVWAVYNGRKLERWNHQIVAYKGMDQ